MTDDHALWRRILDSRQIQNSGRAIIFDSARRHILVERNLGAREEYVAFPGGGIELGETLEECISRELDEEIAARVVEFEFLFLVENLIPFEGEYLHGIELYCEVKLESDEIESQLEGYEFPWLDVDNLSRVDLRPWIVRDHIVDGSYKSIRHLVSWD
jgi:8-oxo-dGTP pyrophosphatase MutT (NUDIX family)